MLGCKRDSEHEAPRGAPTHRMFTHDGAPETPACHGGVFLCPSSPLIRNRDDKVLSLITCFSKRVRGRIST